LPYTEFPIVLIVSKVMTSECHGRTETHIRWTDLLMNIERCVRE